MLPETRIFPDAATAAFELAQELPAALRVTAGDFHLAISGGTSPKLLFEAWASATFSAIPWPRIHFWWVDERCVAPTHPDSNFGMTKKYLLDKIPVKRDNIHRIKGELPPAKACTEYAAEIMRHVPLNDNLPQFDMLILGMGDDGHTASIFPNRMDLLYTAAICAVTQHPQSGQHRVTLTGPTLCNAMRLYFLILGSSKNLCVRQLLHRQADALPAAHITLSNPEYIQAYYLDRPAAKNS
ncbi:MAG: 6-phosphogluconolactonase [Bacteroidales bacterium]|jgi:6-phosphogluconolactonase|nr:6-phosphogluconolactonase [Bacteroidales bacterium]